MFEHIDWAAPNMLGVKAPWQAPFIALFSSPIAPLFCNGDWPEETVAWRDVVKRRAKLQLRIVLQVVLDDAQAHGKHHKQNREQNLGDQALPVPAAVVESLDQYGAHLLPG